MLDSGFGTVLAVSVIDCLTTTHKYCVWKGLEYDRLEVCNLESRLSRNNLLITNATVVLFLLFSELSFSCVITFGAGFSRKLEVLIKEG